MGNRSISGAYRNSENTIRLVSLIESHSNTACTALRVGQGLVIKILGQVTKFDTESTYLTLVVALCLIISRKVIFR